MFDRHKIEHRRILQLDSTVRKYIAINDTKPQWHLMHGIRLNAVLFSHLNSNIKRKEKRNEKLWLEEQFRRGKLQQATALLKYFKAENEHTQKQWNNVRVRETGVIVKKSSTVGGGRSGNGTYYGVVCKCTTHNTTGRISGRYAIVPFSISEFFPFSPAVVCSMCHGIRNACKCSNMPNLHTYTNSGKIVQGATVSKCYLIDFNIGNRAVIRSLCSTYLEFYSHDNSILVSLLLFVPA